MVLRNALGAMALDATVSAGNTLLTAIRDAVQGVLRFRPDILSITPGTISAVNGTVDGTTDVSNYSAVRVNVYGTFSGNLAFEVSQDGTTWTACVLQQTTSSTGNIVTIPSSSHGPIASKYFRVRANAWTSGTATVAITYLSAMDSNPVAFTGSLLDGYASIGRIRPDYFQTTGNIAALNATVSDVSVDLRDLANIKLQISGTFVATLQFEASIDGTNWASINMQGSNNASGTAVSSTTSGGLWSGPTRARYFRVRASAYTSGTAAVSILYSAQSDATLVGIAPGTSSIGAVTVTDPDASSTGTLTATDAVVAAPIGDGAALTGTPTANSTLTVATTGGDSAWAMQVSGTFGGGTVYVEGSFDGGTSWVTAAGRVSGVLDTNIAYSTTTAAIIRGNTAGMTNLRLRLKGATAPSISATIRLSSGTGAVFLNAAIPAGTDSIGAVHVSSGLGRVPTLFNATTAATTNATLVVAASRWLQEMTISNPTATAAYMKIYDLAVAPTVGTSVPRVIIPIPANSTVLNDWGPNGKPFATGIAYAVTGGIAGNNATAAVAGIIVDGTYV